MYKFQAARFLHDVRAAFPALDDDRQIARACGVRWQDFAGLAYSADPELPPRPACNVGVLTDIANAAGLNMGEYWEKK